MLKIVSKRAILAIILAIAVLLAAGCGQPALTPTPTKPPIAGATATPAPTPTMLPIKWKMAGYGAPDDPITLMQQKLIKLLADKSNRQIQVEFFPAESLVKLTLGFDAAKDNVVQIALTSATYEPKRMGVVADIANLPWNFDAVKFGQNYRQPGGFYDWVEPYWEKNGLKLLSWPALPHGEIQLRSPARTMEDLKGKIIRTITSVAPVFKEMGIEPTFIPFGELYESIQRGTVDGGTQVVSSYVTLKFYEVAPFLIIANLYTGSLPLIMNLDFYNSLRPDVRKILDDSILEAEKEFYAFVAKDYDEKITFLKTQPKVTVYELPPAELARWQEKANKVYADLAAKWGAEWTQWERVWKPLR